jgi:allophanate hydrolase subunit 2
VEEGPDFRIFNRKSMEKLFEPELTIGPQSNRMAYLLKSNLPINYTEFDSTAVIPGTIQLTPSGQLNILMRDCQTTGGYPRIGILDDFGISRLAQKKPGENISLIWSV